jgi:hypothetical protein
MDRLAAKLLGLVKDLRANPAITLEEWEQAEPASPELLAKARALGLGDDFLALWREMDGFACRWCDAENDDVRGGIEIEPLERVLAEDREGRIYFDSDPEDDPKRSFYPIESFDPFGAGHSCGVVLDGSKQLEIHYLSGEPELIPLAVDLPRFIDLLLGTRGYLYWQKALIAVTAGEESEELRLLVEDLPRLFPGSDPAAILAKR